MKSIKGLKKDYWLFWFASSFGMGASNILQYVLSLYVLDITGSATLFSSMPAVRSLEKLENNLRARGGSFKIITGHTGWTDDIDFAFAHRTELCRPFTKKYEDPSAPYDGYIEDDDTEENARKNLLRKVKTL